MSSVANMNSSRIGTNWNSGIGTGSLGDSGLCFKRARDKL